MADSFLNISKMIGADFMQKIGLIAGSLRTASFAKKLAKNLGLMLPSDCLIDYISIEKLPLYSDELNTQELTACDAFRRSVAEVDGLCLVTPEINHGMPGCFKNALDIASSSNQGNAWLGKPAVIVSVSTGDMGGISASRDLKQVALTIGMQLVQPTELYIGSIQHQLDEHGLLRMTQQTNDYLQLAMTNLVHTIDRTKNGVDERFEFSMSATKLTILSDKQEIGHSDMAVTQNKLMINKVEVAETSRGRGVGTQLMLRLLIIAQLFNWKIVPNCSYAQAFFKKHPETQGLLVEV